MAAEKQQHQQPGNEVQQPDPVASTSRSLYEASTQFKNWRFSARQLQESRTRLTAGAVAVIRATFEHAEPGSSDQVQFLTADEELLLVRLYVSKIPQLCAAFKFPEEVEATAITFLKRFYLRNTVMDWHPKNVMLTALFLATKTTNNPIPIDAYASRIPKTNPSDVLDLEFLVAQSLNFEFAVWHSHRALWGLYLDLQSLEEPPDNLYDIYTKALKFVRKSRLTDAEFIYTPAQISHAAVHAQSPDLASRWVASKGLNVPLSESTCAAVRSIVERDGGEGDIETVREVDRRLRTCKNPEKQAGSAAYQQKKAEEDSKATEKRESKAAAVRQAMDESDPFGGDIDRKHAALRDASESN